MSKLEILLRDCSSRDMTNCFSCTASPTTATRFDAVLFQIRPIRVTRSWVQIHRGVSVVLWSLIFVLHKHTHRSTKCNIELRTGLYFHLVLFISRRCQSTLPWSSPWSSGVVCPPR